MTDNLSNALKGLKMLENPFTGLVVLRDYLRKAQATGGLTFNDDEIAKVQNMTEGYAQGIAFAERNLPKPARTAEAENAFTTARSCMAEINQTIKEMKNAKG